MIKPWNLEVSIIGESKTSIELSHSKHVPLGQEPWQYLKLSEYTFWCLTLFKRLRLNHIGREVIEAFLECRYCSKFNKIMMGIYHYCITILPSLQSVARLCKHPTRFEHVTFKMRDGGTKLAHWLIMNASDVFNTCKLTIDFGCKFGRIEPNWFFIHFLATSFNGEVAT